MKKIVEKIDCCYHCKYRTFTYFIETHREIAECSFSEDLRNIDVDDMKEYPEWCPLEDYENEQ
jgi:hypothetical protein